MNEEMNNNTNTFEGNSEVNNTPVSNYETNDFNNSYYGNNTQGNPNPAPQPEPESGKPSGYAIASLVLGICSIVFCCSNLIGIICGVLACVFAKKENDLGHANSFTKAGMICGIIGIILGAISLIYWIVVTVIGTTATAPFDTSF